MLGPVGYTGTASIPWPGSLVLLGFVVLVIGLCLYTLYKRRRP